MIDNKFIIEIINLHKSFRQYKILNDLSLSLPQGKITVIIGFSGSGKSILLKHIIGLIKPDKGSIIVDGQDITKMNDFELNILRRRFGMLFQNAALFDSMNIADNVAFPLREHTNLNEREIKEIVTDKLYKVGLVDVEYKMPNELSGGMRKRVGLARAIALEPEIILYDEPTTGLDPLLTNSISQLIKETNQRLKLTSVIISHDIIGAFNIADQISMLYDGRIIISGSPQEIAASSNPIVQQFIHGRSVG